MLYTSSQSTADGTHDAERHVRARHRSRPGARVLVQNRVAQALPKLPEVTQRLGVVTEKSLPDFTLVVHLVSPDHRYDMLYLSNYAHLARARRAAAHRGRRRRASVRRRRILDARVARPGEGRCAEPHGERRRARDPRAERAGRSRPARRAAGAERGTSSSCSSTRKAASSPRKSSRTSSSRPANAARSRA